MGTVGGFAGCNDYNAVYTVDNATLNITNTVTTSKACEDTMQAETDYLAALQAAESYQIIGQTLQITGTSGLLTYAANRAPLEGTLWTLVALGDPNAVQQPVAGSNFTALFSRNPDAPSGIVTGTTGCNDYSSTYAASLTEIKINPPASTKKACDEALMQQEQQFFTGLTAATTYSIQGNSLTMPYEDGKQVLIFVGSQPPVEPPVDMTPLNGTTWYLLSMNNQPIVPGTLVSAQFTIAAGGKSGSMTGLAGCNSYNAVFGEGMGVNSSLSSQRVCTQPAGVMQQEQAYLASLNTANGYVHTGDLLVISTATGTLSYGPYPPASASDQAYLLVNATWYLTFYNNVTATGGNSQGHIIFAPNGSLNGFTGCNDFTGNYATNINNMSITNLQFGNKPCQSNAAANQQQAMISILQSARSYLIANTILQIASTNELLNFSSIKPGLPVAPTYTPTAPIPSATAPLPTATATVPAPSATVPAPTATAPAPTATAPSSNCYIRCQALLLLHRFPTATQPAPTQPAAPATATELAPTQSPPTEVPTTVPPPRRCLQRCRCRQLQRRFPRPLLSLLRHLP